MYLSDSLIDQITQSLMEKIQQGEFPINTRLPSVRKHAQILAVSNETVLRAYDKLVLMGYLEARRGSGFYVIYNAEQPKQNQQKSWLQQNPNIDLWQKSVYENELLLSNTEYQLSEHQQRAATWTKEAMTNLDLHSVLHLQHYSNPQGYLPLREQLQKKLESHGIGASAEQIICTNGAADALHLVVWSHFFPSEGIIVECPSAPIHTQRALASGMEIYRVPRLNDGPDLDALKEICEKYHPKAFLMSSLLQNPTSSCISIYKAHQLLKLAEQYNFFIIDDDTYGDLIPSHDMLNITRLANLDQFNRVIQIGSFSKTLGNGLRSGYIAASPKVIQKILLYKSVGAIQSPVLTEAVTAYILQNHDFAAHCLSLNQYYQAQSNKYRKELIDLGWNIPLSKTGMYLWGSIDDEDDHAQVQAATLELQLNHTPGTVFFSRGETRPFMRFNLE